MVNPIGLLWLLPLLLLPGWALQRALPGLAATDRLERIYQPPVIGALWNGWLVLLLASLGLFQLWLHAGLTLLFSLACLWYARHNRPTAAAALSPLEGAAWLLLLTLTLLLGARPFETALGVRDAGVYAVTGFAIAQSGAIVQPDPLIAELAAAAASDDPARSAAADQAITNFTLSQNRDRYIATKLRSAGFFITDAGLAAGEIIPQGFHLYPAWIGLLTAAGGQEFGLWATGLLGLLGVWSVGMAGRRLAGPWVGWFAALLLSLNAIQVWFSRYSTAESTAQFLTWAGIFFFIRAADRDVRGRAAAALLAGIAFGQVALARIDFFLLAPLLLWLAWQWFSRNWQRRETALFVGLAAMLLHAALHTATIARAYFFDTGFNRFQDFALTAAAAWPFLTERMQAVFLSRSALTVWWRLPLEAALLLTAVALVIVLRRSNLAARLTQLIAARRLLLQRSIAALLLLTLGWAYLIRPQIITVDLLFNTRGGWNDPLTRDAELVAADVRSGVLSRDEAQLKAGVVLSGDNRWQLSVDDAATAQLRPAIAAERGPWQGPFSNQTSNWLRLQGYIGAPINLPTRLFYPEYRGMNWLERLLADESQFSGEPALVQPKELIPLAALVRVGWYLSPLGVLLAAFGFAAWWYRGLDRRSWLLLSVVLIGSFFYLRQTYGTSEQTYVYILRRFVPIAYPGFALSAAYALALIAGTLPGSRPAALLRRGSAAAAAALLVLFLAWTGRPIFVHSEYRGLLSQLDSAAANFTPGRDVVLLRGGAPIYAQGRDIPDLIATPLRFGYGINALTVKSTDPSPYAAELAAQVRAWQADGRAVYLLLSASGGAFTLPGLTLEPLQPIVFDIEEFEQLTDQKPMNVARLELRFMLYRLTPAADPTVLPLTELPLTPDSFAAQLQGFYRPERYRDEPAVWTNGDAWLRLPAGERELTLRVAGGERPAAIGSARVCLSAVAEDQLWPLQQSPPIAIGCYDVAADPTEIRFQLPPTAGSSVLLQLSGADWVPALVDARRNDARAVHLWFLGLR
jgi:hypothetical protein